ncbi:uncharacterized protein [Triticum aestivum]|uniref:uncharacterized protein isoform X2 n=1 Tax=Triticum aestivum TaxID=4565 RepID=UPI001D00FC6D|nr:uncharacterized protein LOC123124902 isoform X2 [Triticum aestivum]
MSVPQATPPDRSIPCSWLEQCLAWRTAATPGLRPLTTASLLPASSGRPTRTAMSPASGSPAPGGAPATTARTTTTTCSTRNSICLALMLQVILNEIRNRQLRKESRCSGDSPALSGAFIWFFTPLDPRSVLEKVSSPEKHVVAGEEKGEAEAEAGSDAGDVESEAFFSVKSFFTRSTSRAATVASLTDMDPPATWDGFRDCEGWPFGLCRRPAVPPLPSTPADSWKWRKQSSGRSLAARPRPAHGDKITTS